MTTSTRSIPGMMQGGHKMPKWKSPYDPSRGGHELPFSNVSASKAKKMLKEGTAHGHKLTKKQRGALGARAGGSRPKSK